MYVLSTVTLRLCGALYTPIGLLTYTCTHARLSSCRIAVETAIKAARGRKDELQTEGHIAAFLGSKLGSTNFKNIDLTDAARWKLNNQTVYVTTNCLIKELKGKKVNLAMLEDPFKSKYMFREGNEEGSLLDLIRQQCSPLTDFPSTATGVWEAPTCTGHAGRSTRSSLRRN